MRRALGIVAVALAGLAAGWLFGLWLASRHHSVDAAREQRLRDSLHTLEIESARLTRRDSQTTAELAVANLRLDSALATPPQVVYVTRTRTIAVAGDSGVQTIIDSLPYVAKSDYDTLASRCSVVQLDCKRSLAVKDSLYQNELGKTHTLGGLVSLRDEQIAALGRRNLRRDLKVGGVSGLIGMGLGAALGGLVCAGR